jgi:PAS domain S-box-containing protein
LSYQRKPVSSDFAFQEDMNKTTILIVEDEAIVAADLAGKLRQLGYEVAGIAAKGEEAIVLADSLRPDLVLMDIQLEGHTDGIEAAEAISSQLDLPIIYLTAHSDAGTLARAKLSGPFGFILKPFEERELATNIEMALYKHQADRQLREQRDQLSERTMELQTANETLRASRTAALNLMDDAIAARERAEKLSVELSDEIAERKRVEEKLRMSEQRLVRAQEIAHLGSWELDLLRNDLTWSDEVYRIFGLQPQEFGATYGAFLERLHPDDRVAVDAAYSDSLREGKDSYEIEHRVVRKDTGEVRWVHEKCQHIRDDAGMIIRSVGMVLDITERKRSQEALRESEQRVRLKLESVLSPEGDIGRLELGDLLDSQAIQSLMDDFYKVAHLPVSILDAKGKVLVGAGWQEICTKFHRVNLQTCQYCLESDTELSADLQAGEFRLYKCKNNMWDIATPIIVSGKRLGGIFSGQFFFDDETPDREQFRAQAREYGFDEEEYLSALDKVPRLSRETVDRGMAFFLKLADMLSKLGYSNVKLARLLTERDQLTEDLQRSNSDLEQFAYIASHDLQSPLRNVEGFVQLLARRYRGKLDGKADEFIQYIATGVKDMQTLILDILEYSKVGSGGAAFSKIDTSFCISKAIAHLKDAITEKNADIILEEPFPAVSGDSVQITSLFQNLIGNAIKFCNETPTIHISAKKKGREYIFSVSDKGIGINPDESDKIFAVFHRLHSKTEYPGTGIGLAICKKIVERHGGRIWVESEPEKGSTFFFSLPAEE